jgi:hypothetical protein
MRLLFKLYIPAVFGAYFRQCGIKFCEVIITTRLKSSGLLRHVDWKIMTDVAEAHISSIVRFSKSKSNVFGLLGPEDRDICYSQMSESVYQSTLRNIPEDDSSAVL